MTEKEQLIQAIVDGLIVDITAWAVRDLDSLDAWLRQALRLDQLSAGDLRRAYSAYLSEEEADGPAAGPLACAVCGQPVPDGGRDALCGAYVHDSCYEVHLRTCQQCRHYREQS